MLGQEMQGKSVLLDQSVQAPSEITRDKMNVSAILSQPLRQRQAAHQMPASDLLG